MYNLKHLPYFLGNLYAALYPTLIYISTLRWYNHPKLIPPHYISKNATMEMFRSTLFERHWFRNPQRRFLTRIQVPCKTWWGSKLLKSVTGFICAFPFWENKLRHVDYHLQWLCMRRLAPRRLYTICRFTAINSLTSATLSTGLTYV